MNHRDDGPIESHADVGGPSSDGTMRSVLVVEDERINQIVTKKLVENLGHQVTIAESAEEALDLLRKARFDFVLMDVQLPDLTGDEAVRRIRAGDAGEDARELTVVAITGHAMEGDREALLSAGMDDYLAKPVTANQLRELFARHEG
ncbi:MAG: response regulator [Spirochaetota bacterium]